MARPDGASGGNAAISHVRPWPVPSGMWTTPRLLGERAGTVDLASDPRQRVGHLSLPGLEQRGDAGCIGVDDEVHELVAEQRGMHGEIEGGAGALDDTRDGGVWIGHDWASSIETNRRHPRHEMEMIERLCVGSGVRRAGDGERCAGRDDDIAACGRVADGREDSCGALEVRDGRGYAVGGGESPGHAGGLGDHLERRIGVAQHGRGHQRRPFMRARGDGKAFRAKQAHALEQVPIGGLLGARNGIERKRGAFVGALAPKQPAHSCERVPEAIVRVPIIQPRGKLGDSLRQPERLFFIPRDQGDLH